MPRPQLGARSWHDCASRSRLRRGTHKASFTELEATANNTPLNLSDISSCFVRLPDPLQTENNCAASRPASWRTIVLFLKLRQTILHAMHPALESIRRTFETMVLTCLETSHQPPCRVHLEGRSVDAITAAANNEINVCWFNTLRCIQHLNRFVERLKRCFLHAWNCRTNHLVVCTWKGAASRR